MVPTPNVVPEPDTGGILPSTAGYAQMTQLAEIAVATVNLTLKSGWLQDVELPNETLNGSPINVNTVSPQPPFNSDGLAFIAMAASTLCSTPMC